MTLGTAVKTGQATGKEQVKPNDLTAPGAGLGGEKGGAETKAARTYQQSEVDALLGKAGQRVQANLDTVTTERDALKSQVGTLTAEITEAKESITALTKDIDAMSEEDPGKQALVNRRKEWEKELQTLKTERVQIATDRTEIVVWKRDQLVYTVADEFVTATGEEVDKDSFKNSADKFKLSSREGLEALADDKGFKRKSEILDEPPKAGTPPLVVSSGKTAGGGIDFASLTADEKIEYGLEQQRRQKK